MEKINQINIIYFVLIMYFALLYKIPESVHYVINNVIFKMLFLLGVIYFYEQFPLVSILLLFCLLYTLLLDNKQSIREGFINGLIEDFTNEEDIDEEIASLESDQPEMSAHDD